MAIGNGRLAELVHGSVEREHLHLNENTHTAGDSPVERRSISIQDDRERVIVPIRDGRYAEAVAFLIRRRRDLFDRPISRPAISTLISISAA